jgi:hypothetical protein
MTAGAVPKRVRELGALAAALPLLCACGTPAEQPAFELTVRVESDPGTPVPHAVLTHSGHALGKSDAEGLVSFRLTGALGEAASLDVTCPTGFRAPEKPLAVTLRALVDSRRKPEYRVRCAPELRKLVVAVRAPLAVGVPVTYLGRVLARTDQDGAAHAMLELPPGESVDLVLDTSGPEHRALRPQNPELKLVVPERDDVVTFEQQFRIEQKPKATRRVLRPQPAGPIRL